MTEVYVVKMILLMTAEADGKGDRRKGGRQFGVPITVGGFVYKDRIYSPICRVICN